MRDHRDIFARRLDAIYTARLRRSTYITHTDKRTVHPHLSTHALRPENEPTRTTGVNLYDRFIDPSATTLNGTPLPQPAATRTSLSLYMVHEATKAMPVEP